MRLWSSATGGSGHSHPETPRDEVTTLDGWLFVAFLETFFQRADYLDARNSLVARHGRLNFAQGGNDSGILQLTERLHDFPPESFEVFPSVSVGPGTFAVPDLSQNRGFVASSCREALVHISRSFGSFDRTKKISDLDAWPRNFFGGAVIVYASRPINAPQSQQIALRFLGVAE